MKMSIAIPKTTYSAPLRILFFFGGWVIRSDKSYVVLAYTSFTTIGIFFSSYLIYLFSVDFYESRDNFFKMCWNLCVTLVFGLAVIQNILIIANSSTLISLRAGLNNVANSRKSEKHIRLNRYYEKEYSYLAKGLIISGITAAPCWLGTQYYNSFWGDRDIPLPLHIPFELDLKNDDIYNITYVIVSFLGIIGVIYVVTVHLVLYSYIIPITREFQIFLEEIRETFESEDFTSQCETNPILKRATVKLKIKELVIQHQQLLRYTNDFEKCFCLCLLLQHYIGILLSTFIIVQCIMAINGESFSLFLSYQIIYFFVVMYNLFTTSLTSTRIKEMSKQVGELIYLTADLDVIKIVKTEMHIMAIMSRMSVKITVGKIINLDMSTFVAEVRNIWSCLTLFQQFQTIGQNSPR